MIKIITLAFESENQCFNDEALQGFLAGKNIKKVKPEFFQLDGQSYWTVWVEYEPLLREPEKTKLDKNFSSFPRSAWECIARRSRVPKKNDAGASRTGLLRRAWELSNIPIYLDQDIQDWFTEKTKAKILQYPVCQDVAYLKR